MTERFSRTLWARPIGRAPSPSDWAAGISRPYTVNPPSPKPTAEATDELVDRLWSEREALSAHLFGAAERLRALALRNFEVLDEVAGGKALRS